MTVTGRMNYVAPMTVRARFHANDASRDVLTLDPRTVDIEDVRGAAIAPTLEREGFSLFPHKSRVEDFRNTGEVAARYPAEIERLVLEVSAADHVVVTGSGILRFGERSADCGQLNNSRPARFIHVDVSNSTAAQFATRSKPAALQRRVRRFAHYNIWRVISPPPQDVPLAVCDARTVAPADLMPADAVFDHRGQPEWSFEGLVVHFNPVHRWCYYSNMNRGEALVFKTHDSQPGAPSQVPHSAFDDPTCPQGVEPRASIEIRAIAYWA